MSGQAAEMTAEAEWLAAAVDYRRALEVLHWAMPPCLPGESAQCSGSAHEHAAAYLGALRAVVEFKLSHLHLGRQGEHVARHAYLDTKAELEALEAARPCGRDHA